MNSVTVASSRLPCYRSGGHTCTRTPVRSACVVCVCVVYVYQHRQHRRTGAVGGGVARLLEEYTLVVCIRRYTLHSGPYRK